MAPRTCINRARHCTLRSATAAGDESEITQPRFHCQIQKVESAEWGPVTEGPGPIDRGVRPKSCERSGGPVVGPIGTIGMVWSIPHSSGSQYLYLTSEVRSRNQRITTPALRYDRPSRLEVDRATPKRWFDGRREIRSGTKYPGGSSPDYLNGLVLIDKNPLLPAMLHCLLHKPAPRR
jgi:hypothetical protein